MRLTLVWLLAIVAACMTGTLIPAADVFHAWWFLALVAALAVSLLACGVRQGLALRGAHGAQAGRTAASLLLHAGLLTILAGAAIRGAVGERGAMRLHAGETATVFEGADGPHSLPFAVTLNRFEVERLTPAVAPDADAPGGIRNFRSTVALAADGRAVCTGVIAVNAPLAWHGYTLYQSGYNPCDPGWTSLLVVRDPGVPVVYAGFAMVLTGLFPVLFVWPKDPAA